MAIQKITSGILADGAIVAADIANGSITTAKIADGNVTSAKIDTVANTKITGLVTSGQIANVANTQVTGSIEATQVGTTVSQLFGMRNRIINGAMEIDQRNSGASVTPANGTYTLDRWGANQFSSTGKFSVQQNVGSVTPPAGFANYLGVTSLSAYSIGSNDIYAMYQAIEGNNIADLAWGTANAKTITLSFWVRSSLTGTFGGSLQNNDADLSYPYTYTISSVNTWEYKTVTIAGPTSGTWLATNGIGILLRFGLGAGSTRSATAGSWQAGNFNSATGAVSVVGTNGATFYITGVQLEVGSTATPFERRLYNQELANCQRYLPAFGGNGTGGEYMGYSYTTNGSVIFFPFPVLTRTAPTSMTTTGTFLGYNASNSSSSATLGFNTGDSLCASVIGTFTSTSGTPSRVNLQNGRVFFNGCEL
jgi:hypothetical protein